MNRLTMLALAAMLTASQANAQVLFSESFSGGTSDFTAPFFTLENNTLTFDGNADLAFDYSAIIDIALGTSVIPEAPNSAPGDTPTTGAFFQANLTDAGPVDEGESVGAISAFNLPTSGSYTVKSDVYLFQNGTSGTTEYAIFGIGFDSGPAPLSRFSIEPGEGLSFEVNTDGDSSIDLIGSAPSGRFFTESLEDIPDGTIPGVPTGPTGAIGFANQWVELEITFNEDQGVTSFRANGALIASIAADFSGEGIFIGHTDPFNSVNPPDFALSNFQNGTIFDNITVSVIPEPASVALIGMAAFGVIARRRR